MNKEETRPTPQWTHDSGVQVYAAKQLPVQMVQNGECLRTWGAFGYCVIEFRDAWAQLKNKIPPWIGANPKVIDGIYCLCLDDIPKLVRCERLTALGFDKKGNPILPDDCAALIFYRPEKIAGITKEGWQA